MLTVQATANAAAKEYFPDEVAKALAEGEQAKARVRFCLEDFVEDEAETTPKDRD